MRTLAAIIICLLSMPVFAVAKKIPAKTRKLFTICLTDARTGLENRINIAGYYRCIYRHEQICDGDPNAKHCFDSSILHVIFYSDGTIWQSTSSPYYASEPSGYPENEFIRQINKKHMRESAFNWGIYKVEGDTIIAQIPFPLLSIAANRWAVSEIKYIIRNSNTIEYLPEHSKMLLDPDELKKTNEVNTVRKPYKENNFGKKDTYYFIPFKNLPTPDFWFKKDDWLWCK